MLVKTTSIKDMYDCSDCQLCPNSINAFHFQVGFAFMLRLVSQMRDWHVNNHWCAPSQGSFILKGISQALYLICWCSIVSPAGYDQYKFLIFEYIYIKNYTNKYSDIFALKIIWIWYKFKFKIVNNCQNKNI